MYLQTQTDIEHNKSNFKFISLLPSKIYILKEFGENKVAVLKEESAINWKNSGKYREYEEIEISNEKGFNETM